MHVDYSQMEYKILSAMADELRAQSKVVEAEIEKRKKAEPIYPSNYSFPGDSFTTKRLSASEVNEEIDAMIKDEENNPALKDFTVIRETGNTMILRFREGGNIKTVVAQDYAEHLTPAPSEKKKPVISGYDYDGPMQVVWGHVPQHHPNT